MMTTICRAGNTINTKIKLFDSNIKTILLYDCETFFENYKISHRQVTSLYLQLLKTNTEDHMTRENHKCRSMEEDQTTTYRIKTKEVEMALDGLHLTKPSKLYHQKSVAMESSREKKV